jgi:homoserine kinase
VAMVMLIWLLLLFGFTLIKSYEPLEVITLPVPDLYYCCCILMWMCLPRRSQIIRSKSFIEDAAVTQETTG